MKSFETLFRLADTIRKELREEILARYDSEEYWNQEVIEQGVHGLTEEEKKIVIRNI